ncbi:MAG: polysaccharide deacetylase [Candidatus Methanomethylicia archaeon]
MKWPNDAKCAVCFTFDVDAEISWRNILRRNNITRDDPVVLSLGLYCIRRGLPRILEVLRKNNIKATFFVPGKVAEIHQEQVKLIVNDGHEIAHHGYNHIVPTRLSINEEEEEFKKGIELLKVVSGAKILGYRSPGEGLSDFTLKIITKHGLLYESSMMSDDEPYIIDVDGKKLVELPWRWILDDWVYFGFNYFPPLEYRKTHPESPRKVLEIWKDEFDAIYEENLYFMIIMHPQVMGQPSRAKVLDELIKYIKSKKNVWIATAKEIASYCMNVLK